MSVEFLNPVFRILMTGVHQQFIHILILKAWDEPAMAEAVAIVDKADFPVAMRLAHRIIALGGAPELQPAGRPYASQLPAPGASVAGIVAAELALEGRLAAALPEARRGLERDPDSSRLIDAALQPRARHLAWLQSRRGARATPLSSTTADATDVFFAQLIALIEQSFVHAFALWHAGARDLADAAWATSGAAMVQADRIVTQLARRGAVPRLVSLAAESFDPPRPGADAATMVARDGAMAARCQELAAMAASGAQDGALAALLRAAETYYDALRAWRAGRAHPAADRPAAFRSFARMLERYVPDAA